MSDAGEAPPVENAEEEPAPAEEPAAPAEEQVAAEEAPAEEAPAEDPPAEDPPAEEAAAEGEAPAEPEAPADGDAPAEGEAAAAEDAPADESPPTDEAPPAADDAPAAAEEAPAEGGEAAPAEAAEESPPAPAEEGEAEQPPAAAEGEEAPAETPAAPDGEGAEPPTASTEEPQPPTEEQQAEQPPVPAAPQPPSLKKRTALSLLQAKRNGLLNKLVEELYEISKVDLDKFKADVKTVYEADLSDDLLEKLFRVVDNDRGGTIDPEEFEQFKGSVLLFKKYDADTSGAIDIGEFTSLVKDFYPQFKDNTIQSMFQKLDVDNSTDVDLAEFFSFKTMLDSVRKYDNENKGGLNFDEFTKYISENHAEATETQIENMFKKCDEHNDEIIDLDEFVSFKLGLDNGTLKLEDFTNAAISNAELEAAALEEALAATEALPEQPATEDSSLPPESLIQDSTIQQEGTLPPIPEGTENSEAIAAQEGEFSEAREDLEALMKDYEEVIEEGEGDMGEMGTMEETSPPAPVQEQWKERKVGSAKGSSVKGGSVRDPSFDDENRSVDLEHAVTKPISAADDDEMGDTLMSINSISEVSPQEYHTQVAAQKILAQVKSAMAAIDHSLNSNNDDGYKITVGSLRDDMKTSVVELKNILTELKKPKQPKKLAEQLPPNEQSAVDSSKFENPELRDLVKDLEFQDRQTADALPNLPDTIIDGSHHSDAASNFAPSVHSTTSSKVLRNEMNDVKRVRMQVRQMGTGAGIEDQYTPIPYDADEAQNEMNSLQAMRRQIRYLFGQSSMMSYTFDDAPPPPIAYRNESPFDSPARDHSPQTRHFAPTSPFAEAAVMKKQYSAIGTPKTQPSHMPARHSPGKPESVGSWSDEVVRNLAKQSHSPQRDIPYTSGFRENSGSSRGPIPAYQSPNFQSPGHHGDNRLGPQAGAFPPQRLDSDFYANAYQKYVYDHRRPQ